MRVPIRVLPFALVALLAPEAAAAAVPQHGHLPAVVRTASTALFPEGVAWDPTRHAFLVGSARNGTVSVVRPGGDVQPLVDDPGVVSTFGLAIDARRGRVLVTYADIGLGERSSPGTAQQQSGLLVADLATGRVLRRIDLALGDGPHAANDVAVDPGGNAWVTDTLGDAVFRVDPARGVVLGAVRDPRFASDAFGVNGIVWSPRGFALTARYDTGQLFRISADGRRVAEVPHAEPLTGADGMLQLPDGTLAVVTNRLGADGSQALHLLRSAPGGRWTRAESVRTVAWPDAAPTTEALTPDGAYVISGRLDLLNAGDSTPVPVTLRRLPAR